MCGFHSFSAINPKSKYMGNFGCLPHIRKYGDWFVELWRVQLHASTKGHTCAFQFFFSSGSKVPNLSDNVLLNIVIIPFPILWQGVVLDFLVPFSVQSYLIK